jgi:hypothetical protein
VGTAAGLRHPRCRRARCPGAAHTGRATRRRFHHGRRIQRRRGRERAVRPRISSLPPAGGATTRLAPQSRGDRAVLGGMVGALPLRVPPCTTLARCGGALPDHAEVPVVPADRRHDRGAYHLLAGAAGRRPQLGLPLLLDQGRHAHSVRAPDLRLPPGSGCLARVAGARRRRPPRRAPGHLRHRRSAPPARARAAMAARLRAQPPRADRQRRVRAAAARRVRRTHGRDARRAEVRARSPRRSLAGPESALGSSRPHLGRARPRHLGGARAAPSLSPIPK